MKTNKKGQHFTAHSGYLKSKRQFLLELLQNPNLLEYQSFTETLLAVFHLTEELAARDLSRLSESDLAHLKVDAERAYNHFIYQWCRYMEYIQRNYPFLFSFAQRTNPFIQDTANQVV